MNIGGAMKTRAMKLNRQGISLTEVLIGIMVLGIGVITLATLFPIGLLRMKRAVNDVRGTLEAQSAANEVRTRDLLAPPLGPWWFESGGGGATSNVYSPLSADPDSLLILGAANFTGGTAPFRPTSGIGIPVVIDPIWMLEHGIPTDPRSANMTGLPWDLSTNARANPIAYRFGLADMNKNAKVDFLGGQGLMRTAAGISNLRLASEIFASPDDLAYMDKDQGELRRILPVQVRSGLASPPPYLTPTYGVPFYGNTQYRERRYTWMLIARKSNAGQTYNPGANGLVGPLIADLNDVLDNVGPDLIANYPASTSLSFVSSDDPARDMSTGAPVLAPVGPFDVTVVVFYNRDFTSLEVVYANDFYPVAATAEPSTNRPVPIFSPVLRRISIGPNFMDFGPTEATLLERSDGIPFPEIPVGAYIMDSTFDGSILGTGAAPLVGPRGGYVYRVTGKSIQTIGTRRVLVLGLDKSARSDGENDPNGYVLTYLKGAVGVFERQVP